MNFSKSEILCVSTRDSKTFSQVTDVSPEIIVAPLDTVTRRLTPVTGLQCIANARPLYELELLWLKDGVPIEQSGVPYSFNDLWNRTLSLISADFVHDGTYTCQVKTFIHLLRLLPPDTFLPGEDEDWRPNT